MVASAERRKELVKNAIKFLRQNHFDGLDLDWEYPTFRDGGKPRDRDNYAQLVQELREEFERESEKTGRPRLLLTMAVPAGIEYINKGYDVPKLTKYLDWMNILSYDYHSAFEPAVNHHAPLYSLEEDNEYNYDAELNIDYTIKHYLKMGADPAKLVLGIPTYGRSYTLFNPDAYEIGSPADGPGDMGEATRENGYLAYYEICDYVKNQDWEVDEPDPKAMGPIAFKDNQWVGYDDQNIVRKKAEYVVENGLGGIMFWAIDNDDFRGNCHGKPYPLIEAGKEAMLNAYGLNEDNLISPPSKPSKTSKLKTRTRKTTTTEKPEEASVSSTTPRRRRIKTKSRNDETGKSKKSGETSTYSSLKIVTPAYTTPEPPATPDMGGAFKCEDEGFFPHPKDCKKYYWCLSGAGDSGIVAHQFTCPAGLYFNKAADSCDYSQNVFCNKKAQKATTQKATATTEASTTAASVSTTRPPPKITAATSKTTFNFRTTTTTTEAPVDDEEYEYEDEEEEEPSKKASAEEDPKVIKELIDLIKKAGGIEELEKQLNLGKDSSSSTTNVDNTTPSSISKSLFERVLSKANKNSLSALRATGNRNSGGPQGGFSEEVKEKKVERGRPQYRTLTRQRPSTEAPPPTENKDKETKTRTSSLEYVNIRRPKTSSTTETNEDDGGLSRNKILGELEAEENRDNVDESEPVTKRTNQPQYVNIRRQRPTTTEATTTTSKYASIRRSTVSPVDPETETELNESNNIIRRGFTTSTSTEAPSSTSSLRYQTIRRGTTTTALPVVTEVQSRRRPTTENPTTTLPEDAITTLRSTPSNDVITEADLLTTSTPEEVFSSSVKTEVVSESIITSTQNSVTESNSSTIASAPSEQTEAKKKRPLFHPRPFSAVATTTAATTTTTKVSPTFRTRVRSSTEPTTTVRARTRSRFSTVSRNLSGDVEQEEKYSRTVDNTKPVRSRKRLLTITEKTLTDSNEDYNRTYRPTGDLSDLSSLTAVDLNLKGGEFVSQHRRRRPGLVTTTTTNAPKSEETQPNPIRRVIIRGGSTRSPPSENITQASTFRPRKIIRKFRPTGSPTISTEEPPKSTVGSRRVALFRQRTTQATPSSESPLLQLLNTHSRFDINKANDTNEEQPQEEEEENIKLSESNIRESSKINAFGLDEKVAKKVFSGKSDSQRVRLETTTKAEVTTTPTRRVRTRKIIRRLTTTTTTTPSTTTTEPTTSEVQTTPTRRRKVFVRRLRPANANHVQSTTTTEPPKTETTEETKIRRIFRPTSPSTTEKPETTTRPYRLSLYTRPSYAISSPEPAVLEDDDEEEDEEEDDEDDHHFDSFMDDSFMDNYFKNLREDEGHNSDDDDNLRSTPSYTVYSFKRTHQFESSMNFNDDEDPSKENKTVSKVILTTSMNKNKKEPDVKTTSSEPETSTYSSVNEEEEKTTINDGDVELTSVGIGSNEIDDFESTTSSLLASSTTEYHRRSTLRSIKDRPRLGLSRRTSVTPSSTTTSSERSFKNRKTPSTTEAVETISEVEGLKLKARPSFFKKTSTTAESLALDDLGVDTDAVRTRNKNLFSKRKMNTPTTPAALLEETTPKTDSTEASLTTLHHIFAEISPENDEMDTTTEAMMSSPLPSNSGKLERLIEVNRIVEVKTKQAKKKNNQSGSEEVDTKVEIVPTVNKIGEISRITLIKIVDGDNETVIVKDPQSNEIGADSTSSTSSNDLLITQEARVVEVPSQQHLQNVNLKNFDFDVKLQPNREERKFELFGESKIANNKDNRDDKIEIIDGISRINVVTPKPLQVTETSTIALQGLFKSEKPHLNPSFTANDEVLETGRSEFVNVRLLDQDKEEGRGLMGSTRFIPVRVLPQDEDDSTVRAHVMEILPKPDSRTIKIAPIKVEMARSVASFRLPPNLKT